MLQSINDRVKGWLGWLIVALISVPFALWGINSYLDVGGEKFVAKVNDVEISVNQFDRALAQQRARLKQMFGKNMPNSEAYDEILKKQVLDQLITTEVMNQYANEKGFTLSDESLAVAIRGIEAFHEDGQFSDALYERTLNSQGYSLAGFEAIYRQELSTDHFQNAVMSSAFVTKSALAQQQMLNEQQRNVSYIQFKASDYIKQADISDEEARQFFTEKSFRFMNPEQVSVQYIELKADDMANEIPLNEEDVRKSYDDYVLSVKSNEQRKASHILINLPADADKEIEKTARNKIDDIKKQLDAGENFAALAKKYSDDEGSATNGGDLGLVSKGMMVKPFEAALFALNKGQISSIVRSEFGFHIIQLNEIQTPAIESFAVRKASIEKELKESGIQNLFYERAEIMANLAYENPESLELVADQLKLKIQSTALFTRASGKGIATEQKVRNAAFQDVVLKEQLNSDAIEISNKHVVVIRIDQHQPATQKSFEEVKSSIVAELKNNKASQIASDKASAITKSLSTDSSAKNWNNLIAANKSAATALNLVKRNDSKADRQILREAFKLSKPAKGTVSAKQVSLSNGNSAVVIVSSVVDPEIKTAKADEATEKQFSDQIAGSEFAAAVAAIKSRYDIFIPEKSTEE